jgi:diguanylate cyclase (GGDEF)-like protein
MGFAGRYGGEEFCLLLPNTDVRRAVQVGEIARAAIQNLAMPHVTSTYGTVTASVGVACTQPDETQSPGDLIEAADTALYAAKHRGRNTVVEHGMVRIRAGSMALAS